MTRIILLFFFLIQSFASFSQNWPACDSLEITCCQYNVFGPNTITITVTNNSSVLFDYPNFILFDSNMDTLAIETVTYFGIGSNPQPHTMNMVAPLNLPLTGYLNLYSLFGDTLTCSFQITIPDTVSNVTALENAGDDMVIYSDDGGVTIVGVKGFDPGMAVIRCIDTTGRECVKKSLGIDAAGNGNSQVMIPEKGCYFISVQQDHRTVAKKIFLY